MTRGARAVAALRSFARKKPVRIVGIVLASFVGVFAVGAITFHVACNGSPQPQADYSSAQVDAFRERIPEYQRTEESTYLTLLEWYQVFSYQEYAAYLEENPPSGFPYFAAIGQSWSMYCLAYERTEDTYPFNFGNHLMLVVIGTSFTAEYALKGAYENTIGRVTEWDSWSTPEDQYAVETAREYGAFIPTDPWYAYDFGGRTVGLWKETDLVGPDMLRKSERKLYLTTENGVKTGYAFAIAKATGAVYGAPPARDYLWAANVSQEMLALDGVGIVEDLGDGSYVLELPHYQPFTDLVPVLARGGVRFLDISGNDEIVLTALAPKGWDPSGAGAEALLTQDVLTDPTTERVVLKAPVRDLHAVLLGLDADGVRIEHLFDY